MSKLTIIEDAFKALAKESPKKKSTGVVPKGSLKDKWNPKSANPDFKSSTSKDKVVDDPYDKFTPKKKGNLGKKIAAGTGLAAAGLGTYQAMSDEEERFPSADPKEDAPTDGSSSSTKSEVSGKSTSATPEKPFSSELSEDEKVKAKSTPNFYKDVGDMPAAPNLERSEEIKAMMADMQIKQAAAMQEYRKEKDDIKSRKMWDGIIKGASLIAAGMYALKTGYNIQGMRLDPADFSAEYEAADQQLKASNAITNKNFDTTMDLARVKREDMADKYKGDVAKYNAKRQKAQDSAANWDRQQRVLAEAVKLNLQKQQGKRADKQVSQTDRNLDIQAGKAKDSEKKLSIKAKSDAGKNRRKDIEKLTNLMGDLKSKNSGIKNGAIIKAKVIGKRLGLDPSVLQTPSFWDKNKLKDKSPDEVLKVLEPFMEEVQGGSQAVEEDGTVKKKRTITSSSSLPSLN